MNTGATVKTESGAEIITRIDMSDKFAENRPAYRHERPDLYNVKLKEIGGFELWITPYNRFFIARKGVTTFPHRRADGIAYDPPMEGIPAEVTETLIKLLDKQEAIRSKMIEDGEYDEDDDRWNWS